MGEDFTSDELVAKLAESDIFCTSDIDTIKAVSGDGKVFLRFPSQRYYPAYRLDEIQKAVRTYRDKLEQGKTTSRMEDSVDAPSH